MPLGSCLDLWGRAGFYKPFLSLLFFHKNPLDIPLSIPSLPSTNWTLGWQGCWECTHRQGLPSCRPCGFISSTISCKMGMSVNTSIATVTSARLAGCHPLSSQPLPCLLLVLGQYFNCCPCCPWNGPHLLAQVSPPLVLFSDLQLWPAPFL